MFHALGRWIARRPSAFIAAWALAVAAAAAYAISMGPPPVAEVGSFLPPDSAYNQALELSRREFPQLAHQSQVVILAHRPAGLTPPDFAWLNRVADEAAIRTGGRALSPANPFLEHRLVSPDRQAALAVINLNDNYISPRSIQAVQRVEELIRADAPPALTVEITGSGGIGRDYFDATERALDKTTYVTVAAVLLILVIVYRSPVGALIPLVSIGASVYVAFVLMDVLARAGWTVGNVERIFAVVLLFGAGVDYALFWIARYREDAHDAPDLAAAAERATRFAGPAILASAGTTICGLLTLLDADLTPWQNSGRILAPILVVSLLTALTLSPPLARVFRNALFWPAGMRAAPTLGQRRFWPPIADLVVTRPKSVLAAGVLLLGVPAVLAARLEPRFDSLSQLPPGSSSQRGYLLANEHFPIGTLYSNELFLEFNEPVDDPERLARISTDLNRRLRDVPGVIDVYSLDTPLGRGNTPDAAVLAGLVSRFARGYYVSGSRRVLRFEVLIGHLAFSKEAMTILETVRGLAEDEAARLDDAPPPRVHATGLTPYIIGVRDVADSDLLRVMILATAVIAVIVLALVRDLPLTLFMLLATWLTFGATLMLADLFFAHVMHDNGLDYKVRLIVFVIVMAVGQDYNIFLVTRLYQEPPDVTPAEAARRAIVRTGSVISSCGLIMAATLGSLWAGKLALLQQTGFALALGVLIDTFLVRPLLIPSFFLAARRRRTRRAPAP